MHIEKMHKGTLNGFNGVWCGECPSDVIVSEVKDLLLPEQGMILEHKETKKQQPCVILESADEQELWTEVKEQEQEDGR